MKGHDHEEDFFRDFLFPEATIATTRKACPNETARAVSQKMANLLKNGAEVVETSFMGTHVLLLKNSSAELRLGPSDQVQ